MKLNPVLEATDEQVELGQEMEMVLSDLLSEHRTMLDLTNAHRDALSRSDAEALRSCIEQHSSLLQRINGLDLRRREVTALLLAGEPTMDRQPTITEVVGRLAEPWRTRTVALAAQLRELLLRVQREQGTVRMASESLLSHMDGLMSQLARRLSHTGTYSDRGSVEPGVQQVVTGLDLTH